MFKTSATLKRPVSETNNPMLKIHAVKCDNIYINKSKNTFVRLTGHFLAFSEVFIAVYVESVEEMGQSCTETFVVRHLTEYTI